MFERVIIGVVICFSMIGLSGWIGSNSVSKDDLNTAIVVLRRDLDTRYMNEMSVFNSLLQRIHRMEKRVHLVPPKKYQITVDGKGV